jgi:hypothetical protein
MHKFLEAGYGNYLMVFFCAIGMIGTYLAAHQYKRLINQSENMMGTSQPFLLQIKNKFQNAYYVNNGVNNVELFVQKNMRELRKYKIRTEFLSKLASRMAGICFLLGIIFAAMGYIQEIEFKQMMVSLLVGIITGSIAILVAYILDISSLQDELCLQLKEYLENTFSMKIKNSQMDVNYFTEEESEEEEDEFSYLKESLEAMASAREKEVSSGEKRKLTVKEEKLLEEILKEYFV